MDRAKVAVAIALLRNKPNGVTGEEYTKLLAESYQNFELNWKQQYDLAENEILHLKQKLHILTTNQDSCIEADSQAESSQKLFPTPPCSGSNKHVKRMRYIDDVQSSLTQNTEFIHHVMNIRVMSDQIVVDKDTQAITRQSVLNSLKVLKNHFGKNTLSWTLQKNCVESIVTLTNVAGTSLQIDLKENICEMCCNIVQTLMSIQDYSYQSQEKCVELLSMFGKCKLIQQVLIHMFIQKIKKYSDDLKQCVLKKTSLDTFTFCNSYYLLKACELCLTTDGDDQWQDLNRTSIREKLEDSLLHISDTFPLYAHLIWRICANLT